MRKLVVVLVLAVGFGGLVGAGALTALLAGSMGGRGGDRWSTCSSQLGPGSTGAQQAGQDVAALDDGSVAIAKRIIQVGKQRDLPPRAWQIAIQAGKTESNLANLTSGDRDSLGIFQMRPSMGWGSIGQITDVQYQINKFYDVLLDVPNWEEMRPGNAAQQVERSAFPLRYHEWEPMAAQLVSDQGDVTGMSGCQDLPDNDTLVDRAVDYAQDQLGKPYVWGAAGPHAFDCSGLTQQAWHAAGVEIPKYTQTQYRQGGKQVPLSQAKPGDLVFWGFGRDPNGIHHVALYLGDNEVLHAPQPGENVERTKLWDGGELLPNAIRPAAGDAPKQASGVSEAGAHG